MPIIKQKICFVLTAEFAVKAFLLNHLRALSQFYDITVIVNTDKPDFLAEIGVNAKVIPLKIARNISLLSDLICLLKLVKSKNKLISRAIFNGITFAFTPISAKKLGLSVFTITVMS